MADFIAVIRRAVDGLNDNTPEMRARVYEKARTAVQRQLENMKPRPPEEMLRRQLDKLESAIQEVEEEHSEALPPAEELITQQAAPPQPGVLYEEPAAVAQEVAPADNQADVAHAAMAAQEEPDLGEKREEIAGREPDLAPALAQPGEQAAAHGETPLAEEAEMPVVPAAPKSDALSDVIEKLPAGEPDVKAAVGLQTPWPVEVDSEPESWVEPPTEDQEARAEIAPAGQVQAPAPEDDSAIRMPRASFDEDRALADFGDLLDARKPAPIAAKPAGTDFSWDAPFDDLPELQKPAGNDQPAAQKPIVPLPQETAKVDDRVADLAEMTSGPAGPATESAPANRDPLAELDDLIGFSRNRNGRQDQKKNKAKDIPSDVSRVVSKLEGKSFKTQPRKNRRGVAVIAFAAVIVAVLGGGALALWLNFDKVVALVGGGPAATTTGDQNSADQATIGDATNAGTDEKTSPSDTVETAAEPDNATGTETASLETPGTGPEKFTQRLLTDGTETAGETASVKIDADLPEGKTVAGQTVASQPADGQQAGTTDAGSQESTASKQAADAATQQANPTLGIAQKMFLYEERLGQGTPSAVTGTVTWNVKNENGDSGKPEPVIEAHIDAPERGMKVLVTFKRNTDSSLPASHLIELVFQLPKDFEGGNIESVDRIAMKPNEQNIGNPLIAVPAKITDDFHMIALNDDKDAVTRNLDLMRSRPWIDIPITYRNGRKALITIEKGTSGTAAFEKAMREWAALGAPAAN
jgi:hypothetical protein